MALFRCNPVLDAVSLIFILLTRRITCLLTFGYVESEASTSSWLIIDKLRSFWNNVI